MVSKINQKGKNLMYLRLKREHIDLDKVQNLKWQKTEQSHIICDALEPWGPAVTAPVLCQYFTE